MDAKTDELRAAHDALTLGAGFDVYWLSPAQLEQYVTDEGFSVTFWAGRPADPDEKQPQGYLIARRR